ncbi:hypothetical protein CPC16_008863 [Podila verticillata]|nr:hypothetical protein BGZ59_001452 [Podila verticillata]KAF9383588.1 hypothetical protein CPC16_008863 [Podila verticillata]KAI9231224.1 MAG: large-conductance mechanosensitive channel [Podila humilis]KFH64604.1 hypothetical protein MVEG_09337 [Podila verticillata NRRL 6337]
MSNFNDNRGYNNISNNTYELQQPSQSYADYNDEHQLNQDQRPKKRMMNPAKAVVGGVTQGAQAVRGGISQVEKGVSNVGDRLNKVPVVHQGVTFFSDYRKFLDRGNVIDLAVAVVIGAAFTAIVTSLVTDIITPLIAMATGKNMEENFIILKRNPAHPNDIYTTRKLAQDDGNITWNWGNFVQTVINFFIISACIFILVKVYQVSRNTKKEVTEKKCDYCLKAAPINAVRCPNCTTWLDWDACAKVANQERAASAGHF